MIALCCPKCGAYVIAADRPAGETVSCQSCPAGIAVPSDAPRDTDLARVMQKAVERYRRPTKGRDSQSDTVNRSQTDTARR
jgi:ribosomal protein L37AE/L43A